MLMSSIIAYLVGEFCNSYVLAKMKVWTEGKHLWARTIGSTLVGEGIDSAIFYPLAFFVFPTLTGFSEGVWAWSLIITVAFTNYVLKCVVEALSTPLTYWVVKWLKRREGLDVYDRNTDFNPFRLRMS